MALPIKKIGLSEQDNDEIIIGSNESLALQHALAVLGENWASSAVDDFAVSFISPVNALYGNLLAAWPNEATPEESLILLSRDIETQLRRYAQENKVEYFGLSIATDGDTPSTIPYSWLYDLRRGSKIIIKPSDAPSLAHGLWVGYAPLEATEIEKYRELERERQKEAVSDQTLDKLDLWQRQFVHMLNTAMADMAQNGFTAMSGLLRTISGLLSQGRSLAKAIAQGRGQTIERRLEGGEIKTETDNMRKAILSQLADTSLPETIRSALRLQLKSLNEAANDKALPFAAVRTAAKTGLGTKSDNIVSLSAFAAAFKALSTDRRPPENRLLSTPAALMSRSSVTAINANAETVREIIALLSDKNQPKDVRETIASLIESGQPLTVSLLVSALVDKGHVTALSDVLSSLSDKGQLIGIHLVTAALAETGQQSIINAVVLALAESNQPLTAQVLVALGESNQQIAAKAMIAVVETQPASTIQAVVIAMAESNQQTTVQIVTALAEAGQPAALNTVLAVLAENNQKVAAQALTALVETQPAAIVQAAINALAETNQQATVQLVAALAETGQLTVLNTVITALAESNPQIAAQAIASLVETQPAATVQAVVNALAENNPQTIAQVVAALAESNRPDAAKVIATLTETQSPATLQAVVSALADNNPKSALEFVAALSEAGQTTLLKSAIATLAQTDPQIAAQALMAAARTQSPTALQDVIHALVDNDKRTAVQTIATLIKAAEPSVSDAMVIALAKGDPQILTQTLVALTETKQETAAQVLKTLIEARTPDVARDSIVSLANANPHTIDTIIIALAKSNPQDTANVLMKLAESGQTALLNEAAITLSKNNQPDAAKVITDFIADTNPRTAMQAAATLSETQTPANWQMAVVEKIRDIGTTVSDTGVHITETFRAAANSVTEFASQTGATIQSFKQETTAFVSNIVNEFRTNSNGICPFCKDNVISNMLGNVFGEKTKTVYDSTIGAAGKAASTFISSIMKRPTNKGMFDGMKTDLNNG